MYVKCELTRPCSWVAIDLRDLVGRCRRHRLLSGELDEDVVEANLLEAEIDDADVRPFSEQVAEDAAHPLVGDVAGDGAAVALQVAHPGKPPAKELHPGGDDRLVGEGECQGKSSPMPALDWKFIHFFV